MAVLKVEVISGIPQDQEKHSLLLRQQDWRQNCRILIKYCSWLIVRIWITRPDVYKRQGLYHELNSEYYGKETVIDSDIDHEWERIPHFYMQFYVYQYATGFSAAMAIARRILACLLYTSRCV